MQIRLLDFMFSSQSRRGDDKLKRAPPSVRYLAYNAESERICYQADRVVNMGQIENCILSALPSEEYNHLLGAQQCVTFSLGDVVYESSRPLEYVYFPTTCVVSLLYTMEDGATAEMGLVGNDGIVGVALFLGGETTPNRAVVQIAGDSLRMKAKLFQAEFKRGGALQDLLLLYTQALITQISQTAVCNRLHSMEKRLCRWLLLSHDRVKSDELPMTQEFISNMLGGRRESVTVAAGRLQSAGLIHYSRGHIRILDRNRLEASACECYTIVRAELNRLRRTTKTATMP